MAFPPEFLEQLRERVSLVDVVSHHVKLQRRGREFVGLSPFKQERTPSFTVVPDKGFFHCFSSGEHGDVISFLMRMEGLSFPEAVEKLAQAAGLEVPRDSPEAAAQARRRRGLLEAVEAAAAFYERQLRLPAGRRAMDYLRGRGLDDNTIAGFRLGYAPGDSAALMQALKRGGFEAETLVEAGLFRQREHEEEPGASLRNRVVFPITDRRGRPIAFGGRTLGDAQPKYLNTPETPVFRKGEVLYGLAQARDAAWRAKEVIVVEGYMDAIALSQAGFAHTVASLGTAFGENQLRALWRLVDEPVLCFDGDEAGERAARRAAERALPLLAPGKSLRFARLPDERDPDDLVRQDGAAALRAVVERAQSPVDLLWSSEAEAVRPDSPDRRARFSRNLLALASGVRDETVRRYYEAEILSRLREQFGVNLRPETVTRRPSPSLSGGGRERGEAQAARLRERWVRGVLAATINHPALALEFAQELAELDCDSAAPLDRLRHEILGLAAGGEGVDPAGWRAHLEESASLSNTVRGVLCEAVYSLAPFARPAVAEADARKGVEQVFAEYRRKAAERDLKAAAESADDKESLERITAQTEEVRRLRTGDAM